MLPVQVSFSSFLNSEIFSWLTPPLPPECSRPLAVLCQDAYLARVVPTSCPRVPIFKVAGYTVPRGTNTFFMAAGGKS